MTRALADAAAAHNRNRAARVVTFAIIAVNAFLLLISLNDYRVSIDSGLSHLARALVRRAWNRMVGPYQLRTRRAPQSAGSRAPPRNRDCRPTPRRQRECFHPRQRDSRGCPMECRDLYRALFCAP